MNLQTRCMDCDGTGASKPNCWLCGGRRFIKISKAIREGYQRHHLEGIEDGECYCPSDECRGDTCSFCEGMGTRDKDDIEIEVSRVLICALTGKLPSTPYKSDYGRVFWNESNYLSNAAGRICEDRGWIRITRMLVFGESIDLSEAGRLEAERRLPDWMAQFDVSLAPVDDYGRWGDDGGQCV